jgi:hypothetical protein
VHRMLAEVVLAQRAHSRELYVRHDQPPGDVRVSHGEATSARRGRNRRGTMACMSRGGRPTDAAIRVFIVRRPDGRCAECGEGLLPGQMIVPQRKVTAEAAEPAESSASRHALCLECAGLGRLEFLARGDAATTRRAAKYSPLRAVVLKWSTARKQYERQGILASGEAIERAEAECLADAPLRQRRQVREAERHAALDERYVEQFARAVLRQFPACPPGQAHDIAAHACLRNSGRVGRSAAAKDLDDHAVRLAVVAHVRHVQTNYESLLARGIDRLDAREAVRGDVDDVLDRWVSG